jgi:predicted O-methyltransferase YrrM
MTAKDIVEEIYATREVIDAEGCRHKLHSETSRDEGILLAGLIEKHGFTRTLEVGCAYGLSSLFICTALARRGGGQHTILDPGQHTEWKGIGVHQLRRAGFDFFELIEQPSELALPRLLEEGRRFQFALIDGWHTLDHALLDFFYVNRLLEEGGVIVFDDLHLPGVRRAARYVAGYPNYRVEGVARQSVFAPSAKRRLFEWALRQLAWALPPHCVPQVFDDSLLRPDLQLGLVSEMVAFRKTGPDHRDAHWFVNF